MCEGLAANFGMGGSLAEENRRVRPILLRVLGRLDVWYK